MATSTGALMKRLGIDPAAHFIDDHISDDEPRPHPLIVEHATGEPKFAIVDNDLVPFDEYKAAQPRSDESQEISGV